MVSRPFLNANDVEAPNKSVYSSFYSEGKDYVVTDSETEKTIKQAKWEQYERWTKKKIQAIQL